MKYIFTLFFFLPFTVQAQFEAIVNRIMTDRPVEIKIGAVSCGFCRMGFGNNNFFGQPFVDIPPVRRSLEGLTLNIPRFRLADTVVKPPQQAPCRFIIRCQPTPIGDEPLLLVDGIPQDYLSAFKMIPVEVIDSVEILKEAAGAALYGYRAARGVVLVTTKNSLIRTLQVQDEENRQAVSRASFRFVSADQREIIQLAANDSGVLATDQLKRDKIYDVTITAVGYKPLTIRFKNKWFQQQPETFLMQRDIRTNEEVVISYYIHHRRCPCRGCVLKRTGTQTIPKEIRSIGTLIYPNPARPGEALTLEQDMQEEGQLVLQLFNAGGQLIRTEPFRALRGRNQFRFTTDPGTAAGTYFFQLRYVNGRLLASGKLIIQ